MTSSTILERRTVPSESRPGVEYPMMRTPGGWQHEGEGCPWWIRRTGGDQLKPCKHVIDLEREKRMSEVEGAPGTAVVTYGGVGVPQLYEMIDEFDAQLIVQGVDEAIVENWCYGFPQDGKPVTGLSIIGVAAAAREMAKHGEVIRADPPVVTFESDEEIRLVCTAKRFFVREGAEVEVDSATRALRQSKLQAVNLWEKQGDRNVKVGVEYRPDPKWFEKAYSKAVRNASLPLIRDDCRSAILEAWKATPKAQEVLAGRAPQPSRQAAQRQPSRAAAPPTPEPATPPVRDQAAADYGATTRAILAIVKDIKESQGKERAAQLEEAILAEYPETKDVRTGRCYPQRVSPEHAGDLLAALRRAQGGPPAGVGGVMAPAEEEPGPAQTTRADDEAADNARADEADAEFEALAAKRGLPAAEPAVAGQASQGTLLNPRGGEYH